MSLSPIIRPLREDDIEACAKLSWDAISTQVPAELLGSTDETLRASRTHARMRRFIELDAGGCWTAEVDGAPAGIALALIREGIWGLSLFAVAPGLQARGIGRPLLEAALHYGAQCSGALIAATLDPRALRRYALAGFTLNPSFCACGIVDREAAPEQAAPRSRETTWEDPALIEVARTASRLVRGASHADDLEGFAVYGGVPIVLDGRGWAVRDADGSPAVLAAHDTDAATDLLWACLLGGTRGATVHVDFLTAAQRWAIDVVLRAGLPLSPDGPICARGETGTLSPFLISGAYL